MKQPTTKLGRDLQVGDVIEFWTFSKAGARIFKLTPYTGPLRDVVCALADLKGAHSMRGGDHVLHTSIEADMVYTVLPE